MSQLKQIQKDKQIMEMQANEINTKEDEVICLKKQIDKFESKVKDLQK